MQLSQILFVLLLSPTGAFNSPKARSFGAKLEKVFPRISSLASTSSKDIQQFIPPPGAFEYSLAAADLQKEEKAQHEFYSLDISKTIYTSSMKSPKDSYISFAEKGAANAKLAGRKILHQSILGGCYVGFGALVALSIAGNIGGIAGANPGISKMAFAALFPVNLLLIVTTGGQLFTGNSATVAAAYWEHLVDENQLAKSWAISIIGNIIGCGLMAILANYVGLLSGGVADMVKGAAMGKVGATFGQTFIKAILCNWMVSLAVFLAYASNDLAGKLVAVWFPISTFVAIGLEHSIANLFLLPAAMLAGAPLTLGTAIFKNLIPVFLGNAVAGALVVAGSYSYQFGALGGKRRALFAEELKLYEENKQQRKLARVAARRRLAQKFLA